MNTIVLLFKNFFLESFYLSCILPFARGEYKRRVVWSAICILRNFNCHRVTKYKEKLCVLGSWWLKKIGEDLIQ